MVLLVFMKGDKCEISSVLFLSTGHYNCIYSTFFRLYSVLDKGGSALKCAYPLKGTTLESDLI